MGLDMYAFATPTGKHPNNCLEEEQLEIFYWRKHPALHRWMEELWEAKSRPDYGAERLGGALGDFNCVYVKLEVEDIERLEQDVLENKLDLEAAGFFHGISDGREKEGDIEFTTKAISKLASGFDVYYYSWW